MESNDSPEILDRGKTSDIPVLPSGDTYKTYHNSNDDDNNNDTVEIMPWLVFFFRVLL